MISKYTALAESLTNPNADTANLLLLHRTHNASFAADLDSEAGLLFLAYRSSEAIASLSEYLDSPPIPGSTTRAEEPWENAQACSKHTVSADGHTVISTLVERNGLVTRTTLFPFDGGIALLGFITDQTPAQEDSDPPLYRTTISRSFAYGEKMNTHKNTVRQGELIYRNLIDDVKMTKHIRPTAPLTEEGEKKNLFTLYLESSSACPCFALEITTVGMGFGCQLLSNNDTCQAIMLASGEILSYSPADNSLSLF